MTSSGVFPIHWVKGGLDCIRLGESHFTSGEGRCCAFCDRALRFRAVIVSVSTSVKPHAPTYLCALPPNCRVAFSLGYHKSVRSSFSFQLWGTSRLPTLASRARLSYSPFFRAKSSPLQGKECCLLLKW